MEKSVPSLVDYTRLPLGRRVRLPRGVIAICLRCGRPGLELVFSRMRGRYQVSYWHTALAVHPHTVPDVKDACMLSGKSRRELERQAANGKSTPSASVHLAVSPGRRKA